MNLYYVVKNRHSWVKASAGVTPALRSTSMGRVFGVSFAAEAKNRIVIKGASQLPQFQSGLSDIGWSATLEQPGNPDAIRKLRLFYSSAPETTLKVYSVRRGDPVRINLPSMLDAVDPFNVSDLVIEASPGDGKLELFSSGHVDREPLYRLAKGRGCEIGPGPKPQIMPGPEIDVSYIEEKSPEEWRRLYRSDSSGDAWGDDNYLIGKAHDLPFEDGALDFIFSSHVLEHLYNPLGHFDHWRCKLKPGGVVLCVVPATDGTKDFVQRPTSIVDLVEEHRLGGFGVPLRLYEAWALASAAARPEGLDRARRLFEEKFSIHVHTYDDHSINALLRRLVEAHGFADYRIRYIRNSKDFIMAIKADTGG